MPHPPNEQQAAAIHEFGADLLVSAGAGTGKTTVLAEKYLRLLEERRAEIGEIVAITFTKKAAAEMRDRIRQGLRERQNQAENQAELEFWRNQLQRIDGARIVTFHSLCLGLIQENPLEAGIPPVSGILGEGEEQIYLNQAIAELFTEIVQNPTADSQALVRLILDYGWESLAESLAGLYQAIRESGRAFGEVIRQTAEALRDALAARIAGADGLIADIEELLEYSSTQKLTENAQGVLGLFREGWPGYRELLRDGKELDELLPALGELAKGLPKTLPAAIKPRVVAVRDQIDAVKQRLVDGAALERLETLETLLEGLDRRYRELKQESGLLDFADQQLLARDLLQNHPQLAERVTAGIRYLLVDEFQDTNSLQLEIVRSLLGTDYQGGRLMAVGDIKQSIYRFRGAEADLMTELGREIESRGGRTIALTRNYRSNQTVIRFINAFSQELFAGESFPYEPLEAGGNDAGSRVEFILAGETADLREQARLVARRIVRLVAESAGTGTPVGYGDIVLLFRAGTAMGLFQQALVELGIPYYTASGGDLYRRQEIVDQLNLLRLVQQRYDTVALLGLVSSPYVGLSETELYRLCRDEGLAEAFYGREDFEKLLPEPAAARLREFRELLGYLQEHRELLPIPAMLRLALDRLHYRELMLGSVDAGQRLANLEKLLYKAEEFTAAGYHDLNRFLSYLQELEGMEIGEGEAQTQAEGSDVVRLMTIHRSKGLEFPVVILPDLDRSFRLGNRSKLVFHKDLGVGFKIPVPESEAAATSVWEAIKERERRDEIAELKRVLYVALTRAKRQLILAGSGVSRSRGKTLETAGNWMKWFELLLPLAEAGAELEYQGIPVAVVRAVPEVQPPERPVKLLETVAPDLAAAPSPAGRAAPEVAAAGVAANAGCVVPLKVSGILAFKSCPRGFYLRHIMRLERGPAADDEPSDTALPGAGAHLGAQIGNFVHQAVRAGTPDWPEELWKAYFAELQVPDPDRLKADLERIWRNLQASEYRGRGEIWDEVPFILKLEGAVRVEGRFDRLYREPGGGLVLVDYKTHRIAPRQVEGAAAKYFWQLQLYALAVAELWGRLPDRAVLYFPYPDRAVEVPLDQAALARTIAEVREIGAFIAAHPYPGDYPAGADCENCRYGWFCHAGKA
jgi:ATP-dependent helicase/nuclease subunit A